MLVLSRKPGEKVSIGHGITATIVGVKGNRVRIAFDAPEDVPIFRAELTCWPEAPVGGDEPALRNGDQMSEFHRDETVPSR
jgi:carbon storage regulator